MDETTEVPESPEATAAQQGQNLLGVVITKLEERLDRKPTEVEVYDFIFGSDEEREAVWNKNATTEENSEGKN